MSTRRTTGFEESLPRLVGLDWSAPDVTPLRRSQKAPAVAIPWRDSQGSLTLPVDTEASIPIGPRTMPNGIRLDGEGKWHAHKHVGEKRHPWRKIQVGVDDQPLKLCAIEGGPAIAHDPKEPVDGSHVGDALVLPEPSNQLPADGEIGSVTANGPPTRAHAATRSRKEASMHRVKVPGPSLMARDFNRQIAESAAPNG